MYVDVLELILKNQCYREQTVAVKGEGLGDGWMGVQDEQRQLFYPGGTDKALLTAQGAIVNAL